MQTFIIERTIPGAGDLTEQELAGIARTSLGAVETVGKPYNWVHSYVAGDKIYCVHEAESADVVREHARCGGFPVDSVTPVANVFDGSWAER